MRLACALDTQLVFYTAWNIFPTFPRIHLMSLPVSLSSIHTRILLRNSVGLMTLFFSVSLLPPLLCSDSHWSASQPQPCWSVSARSHDRRVQAPGVTVWPEGQWQCGGYLSGTDSPILPSCWTMRTPPPPPSLPPSVSLSYSLYLSLVGFSQSQQKCTDGQRLQTWTQGLIKLSCFVVKACWAVEFVQQLTGSPAGWSYMQFFFFYI